MPKKERYRLQAMLTVKHRNKRRSEIELARAFKTLKDEEEKLKELEEEKEEIIKRREDARRDHASRVASGESQMAESHAHMNFIRKLLEDEEEKQKEIEAQEEVVAKAKERLAQAKRDYIEACKQVKVMKKHKELWKKKIRQELEKHEAKEMNELGNVLHGLNKRKHQPGEWA